MCPCFNVKAELPYLLAEKKEVSVKEVVNNIKVDSTALHPKLEVKPVPVTHFISEPNPAKKQGFFETLINAILSIFK